MSGEAFNRMRRVGRPESATKGILPAVLLVSVIGLAVLFFQTREVRVSWGEREQNRREYLSDLDAVREDHQRGRQ